MDFCQKKLDLIEANCKRRIVIGSDLLANISDNWG